MNLFEKILNGLTLRLATLCAVAVLATGCATGANDLVPDKDMVGVGIGAVGHYGDGIGIPDYYVNGSRGGNNDGWGGGGGGMCCVLVPRKVTQPVIVKVTWTTCDIRAMTFVNDRLVDPNEQCKLAEHEATVPVNFAVQPGDGGTGLFVHFFAGHRVEVWYSREVPESPDYPGPQYPRGPAPAYEPLPPDKASLPTTSTNQHRGASKP
jgi:hypothetical protein